MPVIANVFGYREEDYEEVVRQLDAVPGISAYELNVSCPNTKEGGIFFSSDSLATASLVTRIVRISQRPIIVKLSPNVAAIEPFARAVEDCGAQAISLINTVISYAIDPATGRSRIGNGFGGLSGPAIKPLALRLVYEAAQAVSIPVIGLGGISNGRDVIEFLHAGARAVQVGTATFIDPRAPVLIAAQFARLKMNAIKA